MAHEQLLASFVLDREQGVEIALQAEMVSEATRVTSAIRPVPAGNDYLAGIMNLRDDIIPIINLKKRLGLADHTYADDAKVAVVQLPGQRYGLLVDDIRDVLRVNDGAFMDLPVALQSADHIVSRLVKLDGGRRVMELLDIRHLLPGCNLELAAHEAVAAEVAPRNYSRYVIIANQGQEYGIPVSYCQEITFLANIDTTFRSGEVEGALQLRGRTVPVLNSRHLLGSCARCTMGSEGCRILVLCHADLRFGMIVEEIREIVTVADTEILGMPTGGEGAVVGMCAFPGARNILLLDVDRLIDSQLEKLSSMARISSEVQEEAQEQGSDHHHHLITEHCYLVFSISKNFAIELRDVQEIIECDRLLHVPGASGHARGVINLRGQVVPVINLRSFYQYPAPPDGQSGSKLIICHDEAGTVALEVDAIVTIYKQEQFYATPSLNPQLSPMKDTLDRLIEFVGEEGIQEHVLVVNVHNLINTHLLGNR
ncbi:MAG: hypothetical protein BWK76_13975 [Desulfobulbaceae bacterium A2]|nr:MAG: hypothetical protein BWK76_13975 [Desulfobulbaceae bacterium A2]